MDLKKIQLIQPSTEHRKCKGDRPIKQGSQAKWHVALSFSYYHYQNAKCLLICRTGNTFHQEEARRQFWSTKRGDFGWDSWKCSSSSSNSMATRRRRRWRRFAVAFPGEKMMKICLLSVIPSVSWSSARSVRRRSSFVVDGYPIIHLYCIIIISIIWQICLLLSCNLKCFNCHFPIIHTFLISSAHINLHSIK